VKRQSTFTPSAAPNAFGTASTTDRNSPFAAPALPARSDKSPITYSPKEESADGSVASATPTAIRGIGRLVISIVASKDGTTVYNPNSTSNPDPIDPTRLTQVAKLAKIENIHLPLFAVGSGTGDTFDTRPNNTRAKYRSQLGRAVSEAWSRS